MNNSIGLDSQKANALADKLNDLLANYQVFYQNLRGFHWNIRGRAFFELHAKFEEFYLDSIEKIDEIAERVLTLENVPLHAYEDYLKISEIQSAKDVHGASESVETIIANFGILIKKERNILQAAADAGDEGTVTLISDYISQTEKTLWMLRSYLKE